MIFRSESDVLLRPVVFQRLYSQLGEAGLKSVLFEAFLETFDWVRSRWGIPVCKRPFGLGNGCSVQTVLMGAILHDFGEMFVAIFYWDYFAEIVATMTDSSISFRRNRRERLGMHTITLISASSCCCGPP